MMIRWCQGVRLISAMMFFLALAALFSGCTRLLSHTSYDQDQRVQRYEQQAQIGDRIQEREQWMQWYERQWANGNVYKKGIEAYNALTNAGLYGMLYAWDHGSDEGGIMQTQLPDEESRILLAGFGQLDLDQLQNWMKFAAELSSDSGGTLNPRLRKALDLFNSVQPKSLANWLSTLAEALNRGAI